MSSRPNTAVYGLHLDDESKAVRNAVRYFVENELRHTGYIPNSKAQARGTLDALGLSTLSKCSTSILDVIVSEELGRAGLDPKLNHLQVLPCSVVLEQFLKYSPSEIDAALGSAAWTMGIRPADTASITFAPHSNAAKTVIVFELDELGLVIGLMCVDGEQLSKDAGMAPPGRSLALPDPDRKHENSTSIVARIAYRDHLCTQLLAKIAITYCGFLVGAMFSSFQAAVDYGMNRSTFGKLLARHQLMAKRLADLQVAYEAAKLSLLDTALGCASDEFDHSKLIRLLRCAVDSGTFIFRTASQALGGHGYSLDGLAGQNFLWAGPWLRWLNEVEILVQGLSHRDNVICESRNVPMYWNRGYA